MNGQIRSLIQHVEAAGLQLRTNVPIIVKNEDGSFSIDCRGMVSDSFTYESSKKLGGIKFQGAHSAPIKTHLIGKKDAFCINLLGLTIPANAIDQDIAGKIIHKLVSKENAIPTPKNDIEVQQQKNALLSSGDDYYESLVINSHPQLVEIQNSPEYDILLKSFSTQINGDHTISATANNNEVNMKTFSLLLASMRTQLRTSTTAYVGALTGVYGNLNRSENVETGFQPREAKSIKNGFTTEEITTICVKFNRAVERVVDKFRDKTLEVAQTTRTSDSEQLDRDIAEQHKLNNQEGRYRVAEEVIDQVGKRGERAARAADAGKKEEFLTAIDEFFKNNILKKVNKHNENITDWNIARDELTAFLATSKADEFFAEKPGKDFNGIELANGLQEYLAEKFPEMKEAEMGALFTKCYSLIHGKDLTAEQLLTHNPTEHSEAVKKIVKAAAEAEAANAQAGPTA